jgi:hypothetical protein
MASRYDFSRTIIAGRNQQPAGMDYTKRTLG